MERKHYTIVEPELLSEYLAIRPNTKRYDTRVRLGDIDELHRTMLGTERARAIFKPTLHYVDGIIWEDDHVILIECKDYAKLITPLYQLIQYRDLFKQTPQYARYWSNPIGLELIASLYSPQVSVRAKELGIKCYLYRPAWILPRLEEKYGISGYAPVTTITEVV